MISKKYFSGFCLANEKELFKEYLIQNEFTVSGFSYGAIKAFEEVYNTNKRVDRLQLFSPAFFQTQNEKFRRMQLMFFKKDKKAYGKNFLKNVTYPDNKDISSFFIQGSYKQLDELLHYQWSEDSLRELVKKGVKIEVYLGSDDKIIDAKEACSFFKSFATVYFIKNRGHIL
ncbi:MAG: pimelyl-ACP methyl ester esterase BioV [Campylobacterota bacterium]